MILTTLALGALLGVQHAMEADHIAAVASLASGRTNRRTIVRQGLFWGAGHSATLLLVGGGALLLSETIPELMAARLEFIVGVMLVLLGASVMYRLWRDRVHFHHHRHRGGNSHLHAHSHRSERIVHTLSEHDHRHAQAIPWRTFAIGLIHGLAGSAALIVLTAATLESPLWGILYIGLFGIGSILGMLLVSAAIAFPMSFSARWLTAANQGLQLSIGVLTCAVGVVIAYDKAVVMGWPI